MNYHVDNAPFEFITGRNPVNEALRSGKPINRILLAVNVQRQGSILEIIQLARNRGVPVEYVKTEAISRLSQSHNHQGVIAFAAVKDYVDLEDLLMVPQKKNEIPFFIVLDGIEDPQNLGAIMRTCDAAGAHGVITRMRRAAGLTNAVSRASAGSVEYVPVARVANISQTLMYIKKKNIWVVGIERDGPTDYTKVNFTLSTAIVIGGEGSGLSRPVRQVCDDVVSIPMHGKINSLNASVAGALVMYEVVRQREQNFAD